MARDLGKGFRDRVSLAALFTLLALADGIELALQGFQLRLEVIQPLLRRGFRPLLRLAAVDVPSSFGARGKR